MSPRARQFSKRFLSSALATMLSSAAAGLLAGEQTQFIRVVAQANAQASLVARGRTLAQNGETDKALAAFSEALRLDPCHLRSLCSHTSTHCL
jgi:hypothetical protein